jgi:serine protease
MRLIFLIVICCISLTAFGQNSGEVSEVPGKFVFKLKPEYAALTGQEIQKQEKLADIFQTIQAESVKPKFPGKEQNRDLSRNENKPGTVDLSLIYQVDFNQQVPFLKARRMLLETGLIEYVEPMRNFAPLFKPNDLYADSASSSLTSTI